MSLKVSICLSSTVWAIHFKFFCMSYNIMLKTEYCRNYMTLHTLGFALVIHLFVWHWQNYFSKVYSHIFPQCEASVVLQETVLDTILESHNVTIRPQCFRRVF